MGFGLVADTATLAQWVSAIAPFLVVLLVPFVRWAVRSGLDAKLQPVQAEIAAVRQELRDHMATEEGESLLRSQAVLAATTQVQGAVVRIDTLMQQVTTVDARLQRIEAGQNREVTGAP